jgi:dTDP-4-amino-4,6-dideoxygalactose transaminase
MSIEIVMNAARNPDVSNPLAPFAEPVYVTRPMLAGLSEYIPHLEDIWGSRILTNNGAKHQALEVALAEALDVPYLKLCNNGTIALLIAVKALGLSGEVIVTPFTFPATVHALTWNGITPVFCDIDPDTLCIDPRKIEALITPRTSAIMGVHVYGIPCDVHAIQAIADKHDLKVVYDAAHAFQTTINDTAIGRFGDISMFSFHATKLFHTLEGGALTFSDPALANTIDLLRNFGIKNEHEVVIEGINGKMNELQAAIGLVNLSLVPEEKRKRAAVRLAYQENLRGIPGVTILAPPEHASHSLQYKVLRVSKECPLSRDDLYNAMKRYNVFTRKYFYPICSEYPCYNHLPSGHIIVAPKAANEVLCLPMFGALTVADVERICAIIRYEVALATPAVRTGT